MVIGQCSKESKINLIIIYYKDKEAPNILFNIVKLYFLFYLYLWMTYFPFFILHSYFSFASEEIL